jgi:predicted MFS family arabinose efflux permease
LREALVYALGKPIVLPVVALTAVAACCGFSVVALLSVFAYSVLGLSFSGYSTFLIVVSLGGILGGVAASFTGRRSGPRTAAAQLACVAVALGVFAFSHDPYLSYIAIGAVAFVGGWLVTSLEVVLQYTVDDEHRGRVMAAFLVVRIGLVPFGALALGALAEVTSPQGAVATYALIALVSAGAFALWALRSSSVRSWPAHSLGGP